jgi:outer membrane lipoprotein SlyB
MDYTRGEWGSADYPHTKVERALAGGAVGGLIGLVFGPLGTLACTVVGAAIGYATSYRVDHPRTPK